MHNLGLTLMLAAILMSPEAAASGRDGGEDARHRQFQLTSDVFDNTRTIRVLLPPSYFDANQRNRRYPVFYFTDGWDAWHNWGLP